MLIASDYKMEVFVHSMFLTMEDVSKYFEVTEVLVGTIYDKDGSEMAAAAVEVTYNRLFPRSMRVKINHVNTTITGMQDIFNAILREESVFKADTGSFSKQFSMRMPSISRVETHTEITAQVDELESAWFYDTGGDAKEVRCLYTFPLPVLLSRQSGRVWDDHRGFYYGAVDQAQWSDAESVVRWNDEWIKVPVEDTVVTLYASMEKFQQTEEKNGFPVFGVVTRGAAHMQYDLSTLSIADANVKARNAISTILQVLSVFEHNRYEWHHEHRTTHNEHMMFETRDYYHWASPHSEKSAWNQRVVNRKEELRQLLPSVASAVLNLDSLKRKGFDDIVHCFILASVAPTIETSYVYWHSCIDVILNLAVPDDAGFSKRFIKACEKWDIPYEDLFPEPKKAEIFKKNGKKFRFSEIRNGYIHRGLVIDDYGEALTERMKMSAMAERMLLAFIGIDYRITPLGHLG